MFSNFHFLKAMNKLYKEDYKDLALFELKSWLFRKANKDKPILSGEENHLNLGCGPNVIQGMVNADFFGSIRYWRNKRKLEWHLDLRYPLNCEDSVFDGVFSEHALEHLYIDEASALLAELYRVMKNRAVIRLSVPNLEKYVGFYQDTLDKEDTDFFDELFQRPAAAIRNLTQNYLHHSVWDYQELEYHLEQVGFSNVERKSFGVCSNLRLCLDLEEREWESLYVEARKDS